MIDIHCHIATAEYDADRSAMLARARTAGVTGFICIGAGNGVEGNAAAVRLAAQEPDIYAAVGMHPHDADLWTANVANTIHTLAQHPRVVAIGEIGLDHHYTYATHDNQRAAFHAQMDLALAIGKPIQIHQRDAVEPMLTCFRERAQIPPGAIHCFTGSWELAEQFLAHGFFLSIPGVVTFKKCDELRTTVAKIPLDRLLLETDCPYLAPMPYRGKRNEPAYMIETAKAIATSHQIPVDELITATTANARRLFGLPAE